MKFLRANCVALAIVLVSIGAYLPYAPVRMYDFRAFYCAGRAIAGHADPYRLEPLRQCERTTNAPGMPVDADDVTVPAPLPGYVLAGFALLSVLPFGLCALLWIAASLAAAAATVALLQDAIALPAPTIAVATLLPAVLVAIPLGQLAPFVGCAIALCAYGLTRGRWHLAALGALATAADPAVAVVLCATLLVGAPATRATIVWGTAALAALALLALGVDANVEYVRAVLHAHALGNVAERSQFSASHFAWVAGAAPPIALAVGSAWYALAAGAGVWVALGLRRCGVAALALVPPAFAVFGGVYVHFSQVAFAIPAFLLMAGAPSARRAWLLPAIFVLAVPWLALVDFPPFALALALLALVYARDVQGRRWGAPLGLASAALLVVFFAVGLGLIDVPRPAFHAENVRGSLAEDGWTRYVRWRDAKPSPLLLMVELPTVLAFGACLAGLVSGRARRLTRGAQLPMDSV
jgi:hypothetical protein